jgi:hypothetical protein
MVEVDTTQWPTVYMKVDALLTTTAVTEYINEMEHLLAREEPFGLIYLSEMTDEEARQRREKEAQKLSNGWLKANRERMGRYCIGIAMVTNATRMMRLYKPIARRTFKRTMGVAGDLFFTQSEAAAWMAAQFTTFNTEEINHVKN